MKFFTKPVNPSTAPHQMLVSSSLFLTLPLFHLFFGALELFSKGRQPKKTLSHRSCYPHLSPTLRNGARTSRPPNINVIMAPNMQSFEALPSCLHVPEEDTRVRCALLGCGMVRHPLTFFEVCRGHADGGATVECVSKSSFQPYHCPLLTLCCL
jgi:hypothetical protein